MNAEWVRLAMENPGEPRESEYETLQPHGPRSGGNDHKSAVQGPGRGKQKQNNTKYRPILQPPVGRGTLVVQPLSDGDADSISTCTGSSGDTSSSGSEVAYYQIENSDISSESSGAHLHNESGSTPTGSSMSSVIRKPHYSTGTVQGDRSLDRISDSSLFDEILNECPYSDDYAELVISH